MVHPRPIDIHSEYASPSIKGCVTPVKFQRIETFQKYSKGLRLVKNNKKEPNAVGLSRCLYILISYLHAPVTNCDGDAPSLTVSSSLSRVSHVESAS